MNGVVNTGETHPASRDRGGHRRDKSDSPGFVGKGSALYPLLGVFKQPLQGIGSKHRSVFGGSRQPAQAGIHVVRR